MSRQRGITLTELVVTIAIVAVLAVLLVPNLGSWIRHYRIKAAVREIVSNMELAKIRALKNNLEYRVVFEAATRTFYLERGNRSSSSWKWTRVSRRISLPQKIRMNVTFPTSSVQFNPHGTAGPGGSVDLTIPDGEKYHIALTTATGKIIAQRVK
ncbi:MAG: prepilin-type N-terminal cleavage/methylation domain-containing protein [Proteobacteria bacterium]|nr:prepilin-type N-terminal cleavage/methylation domain-containing protein [Pseudomonadota bacterium]